MNIHLHISRFTRYVLFAALVAAALASITIRVVLLPNAAEYRHHLETLISAALDEEVTIGHLAGSISGIYPELVLKELAIADAEHNRPPLRLNRLTVKFDPARSLWQGRPVLAGIEVSGTRLALQKSADGRWRILGLKPSDRQPLWLLNTERVQFADLTVELADAAKPEKAWRLTLKGDLGNSGAHHQLRGQMGLSQHLDETLIIAADLDADDQSMDWLKVSGMVYVEGTHLQSLSMLQLLDLPIEQQQGSVNFRSWVQLREGIPRLATARIDASRPRFSYRSDNTPRTLDLNRFAGWLQWEDDGESWSLRGDRIDLEIGGHAWQPTAFSTRMDRNIGQVRLAASYLRLEDTRAILGSLGAIPEDQQAMLQGLGLTGELREIAGIWAPDSPLAWGFAAKVRNIAFKAVGRQPGISALNGEIIGNAQSGRITFRITDGAVAAPAILKATIPVQESTGLVSWQRSGQGLTIDVEDFRLRNTDIDIGGRVSLYQPATDKGNSVIVLRLNLGPAEVSRLKRYLPHGVIPNTSAWLNAHVTDGRISGAQVLMRGPLRAFPFEHDEGVFQALVDCDNITLVYGRDWLPLTHFGGRLEFRGSSLSIAAASGVIGGGQITAANAWVPNLQRDPWMSLKGEVRATVSQILDFLRASPANWIPQRLEQYATASGGAEISLQLNVPLDPALGQTAVEGTARLSDATVNVPKLKQAFTRVRGNLKFTRVSVSASGIKARLLDAEVTVDLAGAEGKFKLDLGGSLPATKLRDALPSAVGQNFQGAFDYRLALNFPLNDAGAPPNWSATLSSDLRGLGIDLPAPLAKPKAVSRDFKLVFSPEGNDRFAARLSTNPLETQLNFMSTPAGISINSGQVTIGTLATPWKDQDGLAVAIKVPRFDFDEWRSRFAPSSKTQDAGVLFKRVALDADHFLWRSRDLGQVRLRAERTRQTWQGHLDNDHAAGGFRYDLPSAGSKLLALDLDRIALSKGLAASSEQNDSIDPAVLPELQLSSKQLLWNGVDLGKLDIQTKPIPGGLRIELLELRRNSDSLKAEGAWLPSDHKITTRILGTTRLHDLGNFLSRLGYAREIRDTPADLKFDLAWPGSPKAFSLAAVNGEVRLKLGRGSVVNVDPGLGRALAVLNLGTLRRLMLLDFKDLVGGGMAYDAMKGRFLLADGQARTEAFFIDSVAARIFVTGRVGLMARDIDQTVVVIPHTLATLPVAGALIGGAAVGMAYNVAQALMGKPTVSIASTNYQIKGSWDDPKISRIDGNLPLEVIERAWSDVRDLSGFGNDTEDTTDE